MARHPLSHPLLIGAALLASGAHATTFNTLDVVPHDRWQALTLALGEERHFRALEGSSYGDALLSVNYTPGVCDLPWLELRVDLGEFQAESRTVNRVPVDLRVDHETLHSGEAEFFVQRGDSGFYVHFLLAEQALLLAEMGEGEWLRLRMMRAAEDPWFMTFALGGAGEAIADAAGRCRSSHG